MAGTIRGSASRTARPAHDEPMSRVRSLIESGRRAGAFRADLPADWLVAVFYAVTHGAATEIRAGRLDAADAVGTITATLLAAYAPGRDH